MGHTVSSLSCSPFQKLPPSLTLDLPTPSISSFICPIPRISTTQLRKPHRTIGSMSMPSETAGISPLESCKTSNQENGEDTGVDSVINVREISPLLVDKLVYDALVWSSLHGLVVGDKHTERSGTIPGVGLVHAPFSLLPTPFPHIYWSQACELAPIFNELVDRVSLDGAFLQESLSRTKKVDTFTNRLLDIHMEMQENNKKEEIRLGLHRSDYMLDSETNTLLQVELNTISSSFAGLGCLVSELHRHLLKHYRKELGLDSGRVPENNAVNKYADALALAWREYNDSSAVIMVVVQTQERNMYDQHWLCTVLKEQHNILTIRKTLTEVDAEGEISPEGTLCFGQQKVAVVYFRAGYSPSDYPSESEWRGRVLIEQSDAIKCPSISYHLVGTKKIQQELAKPDVLERIKDRHLVLVIKASWALH